MKIADLYIRVSTDEQADKGYSQRNQEEVLRRYCEINGIKVNKAIYEDHSAKTFKRPAWLKLLNDLRKQKGRTDLILFTKWDRFSRNAGDAYQMISILRRLGIEPQAVEQPLDLSIPENKMMLAFYLAAPEVENDRRALNVFFGMRRAKKEGRWMGTAPIGYINKITEAGKKYIAIHETNGPLMKWVFEELAKGLYNTEQVWRMARKKGLSCSKNNFWVAIRNPVYCGRIFIPKHKDEESRIVNGLHEPIISEALFYEVQEVLDGRKRKLFHPKIVSMAELPLRGFLICPNPDCGRMLTGSASKGRTKYYHYYHCCTSCGCRYHADDVNKKFLEELRKYVPKKEIAPLCKITLSHAYNEQTGFRQGERKFILDELDKINLRLKNAREMRADKEMDLDDFRTLKKECEEKANELELKLMRTDIKEKGVDELINQAIDNLILFEDVYVNGTSAEQRSIVGSIFTEKWVFDGEQHRTKKVNEVVEYIYLINKELEVKKNGTSNDFSCLSHQVIPLGLKLSKTKLTYSYLD